jgi:hypothetical protein
MEAPPLPPGTLWPAPPPPTVRRKVARHVSQWVGWGTATLLVFAALLPWVSLPFGISASGVDVDGETTIVGAVLFAGLVFGFRRRWGAICGIVLSVLIIAVSVYDTVSISNVAPFVQIGFGLVLTDLAAFGCLFASILAVRDGRTAVPTYLVC